MQMIEENILVDIQPRLVQADTGKRLANYVIDLIIFRVLWFFFLVTFLLSSPGAREESGLANGENKYWTALFFFLVYGLFMGIVEGIFKGRSIGKLITGTKTVNEDGTDISFSTALARGFSRIVPFEPFSALGFPSYPWHDRWNRTFVIDVRKSSLY